MAHVKKDHAIDLLKFFATFLALNSDMYICYPRCEYLATGGTWGDSLFFFASGFTLFLGTFRSFPEYIKRRISRIYPSVIAMALCVNLVWDADQSFVSALTYYWFINCIMIYYVILWVCRRLEFDFAWVIPASIVVSCVILLLFYDFSQQGLMYGDVVFQYFVFYSTMALGTYMGQHRSEYKCRWWHILLLGVSVGLWYMICYCFNDSAVQLLSLIPLLTFCYASYVCATSVMAKVIKCPAVYVVVKYVGALCLETYLIKFYIVTDYFNSIFPYNLIIVVLLTLVGAYVLRCLSQLILQTFSTEPYNLKQIFRI